ncbi:Hypothetical protein LUCI_2916 [Lucifera butyrica]|uniref:DUF2007 domain-containing protein n=1 Tax=Lucifera butyrica TaxID=1351585 RepID=A0A498R8D5_9FIRM|nr:hypothetical protein [Lucifera butyrica]VBB07651.1 Hypothetical protein LUCI_2916 [Lucifera butyrica]
MEYEKVAVLENAFEAQVLDSILNEQGIPHYLKCYHDAAYDGIFQQIKGWGAVYAPAEAQESILEILRELREDEKE